MNMLIIALGVLLLASGPASSAKQFSYRKGLE